MGSGDVSYSPTPCLPALQLYKDAGTFVFYVVIDVKDNVQFVLCKR